MADLIIIVQRIQKSHPEIRGLRDFAVWAWNNLNPRTFTIGRVFWPGDYWVWEGHGSADEWYHYHDCIASSELVDFIKMLGATTEEAIALRDHLINQGFYKIVFDLDGKDVRGRPSKYLLRLNV